ncbi:putative GTP pyrophosphokinase [Clostridium amylolyticum]|uniref:Putative GTP pyrophosphokinase n=1 Tax=Clostridium amylolyticum TaxID=1121298 RepID=A0A1M6F2G2_9CLOT|nr:GTP pyrophosphokinase family protein [Clostridium amylolyticum]SHI91845.1 putative GTP pyrophosphokinase [Clostridium amylolyticum]
MLEPIITTDDINEWKNFLLLYKFALDEINTKLTILNEEFQLIHSYNPIEHIKSRLKTPKSISDKLRRKGHEVSMENAKEYIYDIAGIRVITSFTSDIYNLVALICKQNDIKVVEVKDYIKNPKPNGYRSLHLLLEIPVFLSDRVESLKVEIQLRTIAMDFWASLEHKIYYKFEKTVPSHITEQLRECADLANFLDEKMLSINEEIKKYK